MTRRRATYWLAALTAVSFSVATTGLVWANNQWGNWHWDHTTVGTQTSGGGSWGSILSSEVGDWDRGTCMKLGGGGEISVGVGFYGSTGWLGIARILDYQSGGVILECEALMNRSYLDGSGYNETADRHVTCQEIGHCLGLDHRHGRSQTCMNDRTVGYPDFDQHDADTVAEINCGGGGGGCDLGQKNDPCSSNGDCCSGICKNNGRCR